jgi:hypothetical protein
MNKSLIYTPSSKSSDDEEEKLKRYFFISPFLIDDDDDDKGTSACHIINKQLKHLLRDDNHLP